MKRVSLIVLLFFCINAFSQNAKEIIHFTDSINSEMLSKDKLIYYYSNYVNPDDYNGILKKAYLLYNNELYEESVLQFNKVIDLYEESKGSDTKFILFNNNDPQPQIYLSIAMCKHRLQQLDSAIYYCEKSLSFSKLNEGAYNELSSIYIDKDNLLEAKRQARKSIAINEKSGIGYYLLGYISIIEMYQPTTTVSMLKKSIELNPNNDQSCVLLGTYFYERKKFDKALIYIDLAIKNNTKNISAYLIKSNIKLYKPDLIAAYKTIEDAHLKFPENEQITYTLGILSFLYDKPDKGVEYLSILYKKHRDEKIYDKASFDYKQEEFESLILMLAEDSLSKNLKKQAYIIFTEIIKGRRGLISYNLQLDPSVEQSNNKYYNQMFPLEYEFYNRIYLYAIIYSERMIGYANFNQVLYDKLEYNRKAINLNIFFARYLMDQADYKNALVYINRAIKTNPEKVSSYYIKGLILYNKKKYKEAEIEFLKAINLDDKSFASYNSLGLIYSVYEKDDEAKYYYQKAIELNPNEPSQYNNLGVLYYNNNLYDSAIAVYDKAIALDKNFLYAHVNKSNALMAKGTLLNVKKGYSKAVKGEPNNLYFNLKMGDYYYYTSDYIVALRYYNIVISLKDNYAKVYVRKGNCFLSIKNPKKSMQLYNKALSIDAEVEEVNARIARVYLFNENEEKFIEYTNIELDKHPDNEIGLINKAFIKLKSGKIEQATKIYEKVIGYPNYNEELIFKDLKRVSKAKTYKKEAKEISIKIFNHYM